MTIDELLGKSGIETRAELARVCKVSRQAVQRWESVPVECCQLVELATGIRCEELRPDQQWTRKRGSFAVLA